MAGINGEVIIVNSLHFRKTLLQAYGIQSTKNTSGIRTHSFLDTNLKKENNNMDKEEVFQIPATLTTANALSHSKMKLSFHTQEGLGSESMKRLMELYEKTGWLSFNVEAIEAENIVNLPAIDPKKYDSGKTPGERLRSTIWVLWEKKGKPGVFEDFRIKCYARFQKIISEEIEKYE